MWLEQNENESETHIADIGASARYGSNPCVGDALVAGLHGGVPAGLLQEQPGSLLQLLLAG